MWPSNVRRHEKSETNQTYGGGWAALLNQELPLTALRDVLFAALLTTPAHPCPLRFRMQASPRLAAPRSVVPSAPSSRAPAGAARV